MHKSQTAGTMFSLTLKAYRQWKIDSIDESLNVVEIYNAFRRSRRSAGMIWFSLSAADCHRNPTFVAQIFFFS